MKLITETTENIKPLIESTKGGAKTYYLTGVMMEANVVNRNKRMYKEDILKKETGRYIKEYVNKNRALGELNHPEGPTVNLDRVSHMVSNLTESGNQIIGKMKILETPMGKIVKALIDEGAQLGVSSRGMGSLKNQNGVNIVQEDFTLAAIDIVADPSAPNAFVEGIMENVEWIYDPVHGTWHEEKLQETKKHIHRISKRELEEQKLHIFEDYLASLTVKNRFL